MRDDDELHALAQRVDQPQESMKVRVVESRFDVLGDRLVSAVLFSGKTEAEFLGASPAMIAHVAEEANRLAHQPMRAPWHL